MSNEERKYYCRICGVEIDEDRALNHDSLCDFCEQEEEDEEDFDLIGNDLGL